MSSDDTVRAREDDTVRAEEIAATFDAAAADFDRVTPDVWGPAGQCLVFQAGLRSGDTVLDVGSGTGASALPAAVAVGPTGQVHAIDLSDEMLERGRVKASERALLNIEFVTADATTWEAPSSVPDAGYDAVLSSYSVFFLPEMDESFARLLRLVRPGGTVGVTAWRETALREYATTFLDALGPHLPQPLPDLTAQMEPAQRLDTPDKLRGWLTAAGTEAVEVRELSNLIPATEEFCWSFVLGSGLRATLAGLAPDVVEQVRTDFMTLIIDRGLHTIDASTLVGTAKVVGFGGPDKLRQ
ncbi:class I SAM-dependent methyltransferase [Rhodococcus spongiicola]|uniref:Class I SAM-dependent methyltransferase n=1 Tax=Rhodococcus spongiicola TaxID=2487352 RepID=A0A438ASB0_9NOCA|nr:class I SAM-dependent methyltransferase [Rhodococcus spongiicola]RVW01608.1 class I SAM-dependent methyltransferase [Rhodococcus spongiicola]